MSIIIATTAAEAAAVVRELDGQSTTITTTLDLPWSGLATDTARDTAVGAPDPAVEEESSQVEDIDDTPRAPRNRTWTAGQEAVLIAEYRKGRDVRDIAALLDRSYSSVNNKRTALGLDRSKQVAA